MAFESMPFDSTESNPRPITGPKWANLNTAIMSGGYGLVNLGDPLRVEPKQNMVVTLYEGAIFIGGYLGDNKEPEDLELDAADPNNDRIDRVVIRFNNSPTERRIYPTILKGDAGANPQPPALTREGMIYDMSVAQIRVIAGKSFIESSQIIDERNNPLTCGYTNMSNILRGIEVTEKGIVTTKNNSFLEARNNSVWTAPLSVYARIPFGPATMNTNVNYNQASSEITVDVPGIYNFRILITIADGHIIKDNNIQVLAYKNGVEDRLIAQKVISSGSDNMLIASGFMNFNKGDKSSFFTYVRFAAGAMNFSRAHLTWMKVA